MSSFSFLGRNLNFHLRKRTTTAKPPMHLLEPFSWEQHLCLGWRVPAVPRPPQGQRLPCWPRRLHPECPLMTRTSWQVSHALCWQRGRLSSPPPSIWSLSQRLLREVGTPSYSHPTTTLSFPHVHTCAHSHVCAHGGACMHEHT